MEFCIARQGGGPQPSQNYPQPSSFWSLFASWQKVTPSREAQSPTYHHWYQSQKQLFAPQKIIGTKTHPTLPPTLPMHPILIDNIMTARQSEFCRLFATGMPATKAAMAAGYARTTASQNCATMLTNPTIQAQLRALELQAFTNYHDILHFKNILSGIITTEPNNSIVIRAIQQLLRLQALPLPHHIANQIHESLGLPNSLQENPTTTPTKAPTLPDNLPTQSPDSQQEIKDAEIAEEIDLPPTSSTLIIAADSPSLPIQINYLHPQSQSRAKLPTHTFPNPVS